MLHSAQGILIVTNKWYPLFIYAMKQDVIEVLIVKTCQIKKVVL